MLVYIILEISQIVRKHNTLVDSLYFYGVLFIYLFRNQLEQGLVLNKINWFVTTY